MRISDWSSDVCSSDLILLARNFCGILAGKDHEFPAAQSTRSPNIGAGAGWVAILYVRLGQPGIILHEDVHHQPRSEEHTSELQSLMRISYAVFCLKKKIVK